MPDYIVKPYDVLFFRGNKSFHFGQWYSQGVFPPYPSTFQGFVRHKILDDHGLINKQGRLTDPEKAKEMIGDDEGLGKINITGPYLMDSETIYFKSPMDLFREGSSYCSAFPLSEETLESDCKLNLSCPNLPEGKLDNLCPPEIISLEELSGYRTSLEGIDVKGSEPVKPEERVGIGMNNDNGNRMVQRRRFYVTPYNRLEKNVGLYCHVSGEKMKDGALKLGSESHLTYVEELSSSFMLEEELAKTRDSLIDNIEETGNFRMILLQPGVFKKGWLPFEQEEVNDLKLKLLFAFTKAPIRISGYSYQKKAADQKGIRLKPLVNTVPAGAVYMFKILNKPGREQIKDFVDSFDNKKIEHRPYSRMGFNHVILGAGRKIKGGEYA
ncbi:hypothetical protein KKH56_02340 [bacterium]|nr:hypothetical protein [bacterium]